MAKIEKFLNLARAASQFSSYHHKIGAVVVYKRRVISVGFNQAYKTHPKSRSWGCRIHAEFLAIVTAGKVKDCDIYIYRQYADGKPALSKPCPACDKLLKESGIRTVYYTTSEGYAHFRYR